MQTIGVPGTSHLVDEGQHLSPSRRLLRIQDANGSTVVFGGQRFNEDILSVLAVESISVDEGLELAPLRELPIFIMVRKARRKY